MIMHYYYVFFYYNYTGVDCVVVKCGRRICGTGGALANAPIVQDKSYFEVKIQCGGWLKKYPNRF